MDFCFLVVVDADEEEVAGVFDEFCRILLAVDLVDCTVGVLVNKLALD